MKSTLLFLAVVAAFAAGSTISAATPSPGRAIGLFEFSKASGYVPQAGITTDSRGTIFGTTSIGGNGSCLAGAGCGTVYALLPPGGHGLPWTLSVLYNFQGGQDGSVPQSPVIVDAAGNLYGYTTGGTWGTVFELSPPTAPAKAWKFQILYTFTNQGDGNLEVASPLVFHDNALYGVASGGSDACGQFGCGSVFKLTPGSGRKWIEQTLYAFAGGSDGGQPTWIAGLDSAGALYVSTRLGSGGVARLSPGSGDTWDETTIAQFKDGGHESNPSNLILASDGSVYGIAAKGRGGIAFQLTPPADHSMKWTLTTLALVSDHQGPDQIRWR